MEERPFKDTKEFQEHLPPTSYKSLRYATYYSKFNYEKKSNISIKPNGQYVARQFCFEMDGLIFNFTVSAKTDPFHAIGATSTLCFTNNSKAWSGGYIDQCNLSDFENETQADAIRIKQFFNALETIKLIDLEKNKSLPPGQLKANYSDWK